MTAENEGQARTGIEFAKELTVREASEPLAQLAQRSSKFAALRVMAVEALAAVDATGSLKRFDTLVADGADAIDVRPQGGPGPGRR